MFICYNVENPKDREKKGYRKIQFFLALEELKKTIDK